MENIPKEVLLIHVNCQDRSSEENVSQVYRDCPYMIYRNKNSMLTPFALCSINSFGPTCLLLNLLMS